MASSSLCGPTNALQNFQKHAQTDRTLQQDRITGNVQQPLESFRSSPGPQTGMLDAEYEAFQAGPGPAFQHQPDIFQFHAGPSQQAPMAAPQMPDWASDFQRLHVSHTPSPPPQMMAPAPQAQSWLSGWANDFMQEQGPIFAPTPQAPQSSFGQGFGMFGNNNMGMQSNGLFGNSNFGVNSSFGGFMQQPREQTMDNMFDDAAFERAFEAASMEIASQAVEPVEEVPALQHDEVLDEIADQTWQAEQVLPSIETATEETYENRPTDQDELARTAGRLLESVKDDDSQKFQESTFLALMRRIRDREVTVEGDKMVETTPSPPPEIRPRIQEPWMDDTWEEHTAPWVYT